MKKNLIHLVHGHLIFIFVSLISEFSLILTRMYRDLKRLDGLLSKETYLRMPPDVDMDLAILGIFILPLVGISLISTLIGLSIILYKRFHKEKLKKEFQLYIVFFSLILLIHIFLFFFTVWFDNKTSGKGY